MPSYLPLVAYARDVVPPDLVTPHSSRWTSAREDSELCGALRCEPWGLGVRSSDDGRVDYHHLFLIKY